MATGSGPFVRTAAARLTHIASARKICRRRLGSSIASQNAAIDAVVQKHNCMSTSARRLQTSAPPDVTKANPVARADRQPVSRRIQNTSTSIVPSEAATDGSRAVHSSIAPANAAKPPENQNGSGGLRKSGSPCRCGTSQPPTVVISQARWAAKASWLPRGHAPRKGTCRQSP
ncbi:MAG: hypothetical protein AMS14_01960 [Planctomycetes bacterium DG_20]|nr:MAG: hypothetical protein AMS14_01960 [Planctomycetes bacterium DG_20]